MEAACTTARRDPLKATAGSFLVKSTSKKENWGLSRSFARFVFCELKKLSKPITSKPKSKKFSQSLAPKNPTAPATIIVTGTVFNDINFIVRGNLHAVHKI